MVNHLHHIGFMFTSREVKFACLDAKYIIQFSVFSITFTRIRGHHDVIQNSKSFHDPNTHNSQKYSKTTFGIILVDKMQI